MHLSKTFLEFSWETIVDRFTKYIDLTSTASFGTPE